MNEPWCRLFKFIFPFLIEEKNINVTSSGRLMATLIGNPLIKAFFIIFLVSAATATATATATGDAPFIIAHKKASLNRLKSGAERVSVSVDIYNQGFTGGHLSHSFELEAKRKGMFHGAPAVIYFRIPTKSVQQEAYSTPIFPLDILEERPPEKKFEWRLMAKYGSQISVISIVVLFIYLIITPSKASKKKR